MVTTADIANAEGGAQHDEWYKPSAGVLEQAYIKDWDALARAADADFVGFWEERARELIDWQSPWTKALDDSEKPFFKWFVGAKTNIVHNAIDRHLKTHRKNKLAIIWEGENGEQRSFSYHALNREVSKFASVLKALGVKKGDRVTIYMGRVPELPIAMLACAKIGAVHSVVYGGFSTEALHERIEDSQSRVVVTCDGAYPQRQDRRAQMHRGRGHQARRSRRARRRVQTDRPGRADGGRPRHVVARADGAADRRLALPDRSHGRRGSAVPALHVRHDGQAEGDRPHARRLPGRHRDHAQVRVRSEGRRPLVVRGRSGLGHRPLLHRLRAADPRARPDSCTKALRRTRTRTDGGRWSRSTESRSSTPPRPRSAG